MKDFLSERAVKKKIFCLSLVYILCGAVLCLDRDESVNGKEERKKIKKLFVSTLRAIVFVDAKADKRFRDPSHLQQQWS